jgi:hypothetical protein
VAKALQKQIGGARHKRIEFSALVVVMVVIASAPSSLATTKGLSQIVTPDL